MSALTGFKKIELKEYKNFHVPSGMFQPDKELWWEVLKVGKWYPAYSDPEITNEDGSVDFTEEMIQVILNNTKKMLLENEPVRIKPTHEGTEIIGYISDVRFDSSIMEMEVFALDMYAAQSISEGRFPSVSVEIEDSPNWGEIVSAVALLDIDYPAIKGLKIPDIVYNSGIKNKKLIELKYQNKEVAMFDKATKEPVKEKDIIAKLSEIESRLEAKLAEKDTEIAELKVKIENSAAVKTEDKSVIEAAANNEIAQLREANKKINEQLKANELRLEGERVDNFLNGKVLPRVDASAIKKALLSEDIKTAKDTIKELINKLNELASTLTEPQINMRDVNPDPNVIAGSRDNPIIMKAAADRVNAKLKEAKKTNPNIQFQDILNDDIASGTLLFEKD